MSVDTNLTRRNLAAYHRVAVGSEVHVLLAPQLLGLASSVHIGRTGGVLRRLTAELRGALGRDHGLTLPP